MSISGNIRKILFISIWCLLGTGLVVLLIAAIKVKQEKNCTGYNIDIRSVGEHFFIDKKDIEDQLTNRGGLVIKGRSLKSFDLKKMEEKLAKNSWISEAELFFDNSQVLQVKIKERQPIARVFTSAGNSFYIDSNLMRLPLSEKLSARLPVFTGFPSEKEKLTKEDRQLLSNIKTLSNYILPNSFWMAQVAQIDITASRNFEIVPTIGNHIIEFGDGTDCDKKFRRLLLFYQQVISKIGFNAYERIKVQYAGQVVGVRHAAAISKYDSLQAIKTVERLVAMAQTEQERLIHMDSIELRQVEHRTDNEELPARFYDTTGKNLFKESGDNQSKLESSTLKNPPPYESVKKSNPMKNKPKAIMKKN